MSNITIRNIPFNGSRPNPNMKELIFNFSGSIVFFSYSTPVAAKITNGEGGWNYYRTSESYSPTTTKHINKWLKRNTVPSDNVTELPASILKAYVPANISL